MDIETAIANIDQAGNEYVLVGKRPFSWGSPAKLIQPTQDYRVPQSVIDEGYEYLLGKEDIVMLLGYLKIKKISSKSTAEFIVHYAMCDAYPSWIEDIPNLTDL